MLLPWRRCRRRQIPLEYDDIDGQILIGSNACCTTHFSEVLLDKGVTADISLEAERLDMPYGVDLFLWLPVEDHAAPTHEQMNTGVAALSAMVLGDVRVYVHCKNGHGRAPTLVAAYYMSRGFSLDEAIKKIQVRRPAVHLSDEQVDALRRFGGRSAS